MDYSSAQGNGQPREKALLAIRVMSKRRTWALLFAVVYALILYSSWNLLQSILTWYGATLSSAPGKGGWPALYAAVMVGAVVGLMSMASAAAVALPAMLLTWITVLVLLTFCGRRRRDLLVEGRQLTAEICTSVFRVVVKEGNLVTAAFAVAGYLLLLREALDSGICSCRPIEMRPILGCVGL